MKSVIFNLVDIYGLLYILSSLFTQSEGTVNFVEGRCRWRKADVLFIVDSTENIGEENHRMLLNFFVQVLSKMEREEEEIYVSAAQFTPEERFEFNLESLNGRTQEQIQVCLIYSSVLRGYLLLSVINTLCFYLLCVFVISNDLFSSNISFYFCFRTYHILLVEYSNATVADLRASIPS